MKPEVVPNVTISTILFLLSVAKTFRGDDRDEDADILIAAAELLAPSKSMVKRLASQAGAR